MAEDSANILRHYRFLFDWVQVSVVVLSYRVVAVKNHSPNVRTIVQLIEVRSKVNNDTSVARQNLFILQSTASSFECSQLQSKTR